MRAVFLDRDGTIIAGIPFYERIDSIEKIRLLPNTIRGLTILAQLDYLYLLVTNQAGIEEGLITPKKFAEINREVLRQIQPSGIHITETYVCPHGEKSQCTCRKPKPKLLFDAAANHKVDLSKSWMIGDRQTDVETGINAGTRTVLVKTGSTAASPEATFVATDLLEAAQYIAANG